MATHPADDMQVADIRTRKKYELTQDIIDNLKKLIASHGLEPKIYKFTFDGDVLLFRPLYRADWNEIQAYIRANKNDVPKDDLDRMICERCLLWPEEIMHPGLWEIQRAGIQESLADECLFRSGFFDPTRDNQGEIMKVETLSTIEPGPRPTPEQIAELKAKYNWPMKLVFINGDYYVVRPLNRGEWKLIQTSEDPDPDMLIVERACVWSRNYPNGPDFSDKVAGTVRSLSSVVVEISGLLVDNRPTVEEL